MWGDTGVTLCRSGMKVVFHVALGNHEAKGMFEVRLIFFFNSALITRLAKGNLGMTM